MNRNASHFVALGVGISLLLSHSLPALAQGDELQFAKRHCKDAQKVCSAPLVDGKCLKITRLECQAYNMVSQAVRMVDKFGVVHWGSKQVQGDCKEYKTRCDLHEQVCNAGFKVVAPVCAFAVKTYEEIREELNWVVYQKYMERLRSESGGSLGAKVVAALQPYYTTSLSKIIVSDGEPWPGRGAITDCNHIRFPHLAIVEVLKGDKQPFALSDDDLLWVLHELRHSDQCSKVGGRKQYGTMWFRQFETVMQRYFGEWSLKAVAANAAVGQPVPNETALVTAIVADLINGGYDRVHDAMPMEGDAAGYSKEIFNKVRPNILRP